VEFVFLNSLQNRWFWDTLLLILSIVHNRPMTVAVGFAMVAWLVGWFPFSYTIFHLSGENCPSQEQ
jgi:hypothetical protein